MLFVVPSSFAHEVRPASLDITEQSDGSYVFRWRQPINGEYTIAIHPVLSSGWLDGDPQQAIATGTTLIRQWTVARPEQALSGQTLTIRGLDRTITDVLVTYTNRKGQVLTHLIKADQPQMTLPENGEGTDSMRDYLWLGITHIWSGPDHLLYVLGLVLLIHNRRALVFTISAFTLAHSITLACAALDLVRLRPAPVEAVIALSIVYVAVELVNGGRKRAGLAQRKPWLIAFTFGLLHGFGFAGALQQIGLPQQAVAWALLLFNLGIEAGQLLFVAAVLALGAVCFRLLPASESWLRRLLPYGIGSIASFWLLERLAAMS
ncbi:MAG TPA: HupE/UreJ family protein [Candidatus Acidoferrum sp.]|nr:HupE/UreJ family protein [Candidatus Acidoferrum sp.]